MKVCFLNINMYALFRPESGASIGGTEVQLYSLAKYLSQSKGFEVSAVVGDWGQREIEKFQEIVLFRSFSTKRTLANYVRALFLLWAALKRSHADVFIVSSAGMEVGILALFCWAYRKKFVYRTAHDWDCTGEFARTHFFIGKIYEFGLAHTTRVVAQSENHKKLLREIYDIPSVVIRNGFPIHQLSSDQKKGEKILWVSRCEKWKAPEIFLQLAERLPQRQFVMICPGNGEYFFRIKQNAESLPNVEFIEAVPFQEIQKYFNGARVFVATSEYEGFPNTYLQACLGATPIIAYKVDPDGFIERNQAGICAHGDFETLVRETENLLLDSEKLSKYAQNAFQYSVRNHDIQATGAAWEKLLQELL